MGQQHVEVLLHFPSRLLFLHLK